MTHWIELTVSPWIHIQIASNLFSHIARSMCFPPLTYTLVLFVLSYKLYNKHFKLSKHWLNFGSHCNTSIYKSCSLDPGLWFDQTPSQALHMILAWPGPAYHQCSLQLVCTPSISSTSTLKWGACLHSHSVCHPKWFSINTYSTKLWYNPTRLYCMYVHLSEHMLIG